MDTLTDDEPFTMWIGNMMQLVAAVRDTKPAPRDPYRAIQDALLDLQAGMRE